MAGEWEGTFDSHGDGAHLPRGQKVALSILTSAQGRVCDINMRLLDHNDRVSQVQFVWRSDRKQLHLFASSDGRSCHWFSSRAANGTIRPRRTCSAGWSKSCPANGLMSSSNSGSSPRSA